MTTSHFNLDTSALEHQEEKFTPLAVVPGRVLHVDADLIAHQVSYDEEKSLAERFSRCDNLIDRLRLMSGADTVELHLTPSSSNKGNRADLALIKPYQAHRANKVSPPALGQVRQWLHEERSATMWTSIEADDGIAIQQYKAIADGNRNLSVIASRDKDLCMIPGLQMNCATGEIVDTEDDFGWIELNVADNKAKTKTVKGRGWKFFWAQMLMGDTADNISGLPKVVDKRYLAKSGKPKAVGPVLAFDILNGIKDNKQAFKVVRNLFKQYGEQFGFVDYRDGKKISYGTAFISEAQLLWMRRSESSTDVLDWMKEHCV